MIAIQDLDFLSLMTLRNQPHFSRAGGMGASHWLPQDSLPHHVQAQPSRATVSTPSREDTIVIQGLIIETTRGL